PGRGHYGYGIRLERFRGIDTLAHTGSRAGYGSRIVLVPAHKFGMIVLANRTGATLPKSAEKAMELALPLTPPAKVRDPDKPNRPELERLAGVYRNGAATVELRWEDGKLVLLDGKTRAAAIPLGESRFRADGEFEMILGRDGTTVYLSRGARAY